MKNIPRVLIVVFIFFVAASLLSACASGNWRRRLQPTIVNSPVLPAETQNVDQTGVLPAATLAESQLPGGENTPETVNQPAAVPEPTATPSASVKPVNDASADNLENLLDELIFANQNADGLIDIE